MTSNDLAPAPPVSPTGLKKVSGAFRKSARKIKAISKLAVRKFKKDEQSAQAPKKHEPGVGNPITN